MFSGIIQGIGTVIELKKGTDGATIHIDASTLQSLPKQKLGDSIAVNGVCLTVTELTSTTFAAEISNTTLQITNLRHIQVGSKINLEPALTLNEAVNGHLVSGHVDSIAHLEKIVESGFSRLLSFSIAHELSQYVVERGSITLDGISLTINEVHNNTIILTIVPHTWQHTIAQQWKIGSDINVEIDMIARYINKLATSHN